MAIGAQVAFSAGGGVTPFSWWRHACDRCDFDEGHVRILWVPIRWRVDDPASACRHFHKTHSLLE